MKRLLLLLVPLVLTDPAIAFDGGWYDKEEKPELSTDQSETLAKYSEFHQSCMDIQMTMWGEVAELMEDLAIAHCYCEYTKLEDLESITWADKNAYDEAASKLVNLFMENFEQHLPNVDSDVKSALII